MRFDSRSHLFGFMPSALGEASVRWSRTQLPPWLASPAEQLVLGIRCKVKSPEQIVCHTGNPLHTEILGNLKINSVEDEARLNLRIAVFTVYFGSSDVILPSTAVTASQASAQTKIGKLMNPDHKANLVLFSNRFIFSQRSERLSGSACCTRRLSVPAIPQMSTGLSQAISFWTCLTKSRKIRN